MTELEFSPTRSRLPPSLGHPSLPKWVTCPEGEEVGAGPFCAGQPRGLTRPRPVPSPPVSGRFCVRNVLALCPTKDVLPPPSPPLAGIPAPPLKSASSPPAHTSSPADLLTCHLCPRFGISPNVMYQHVTLVADHLVFLGPGLTSAPLSSGVRSDIRGYFLPAGSHILCSFVPLWSLSKARLLPCLFSARWNALPFVFPPSSILIVVFYLL